LISINIRIYLYIYWNKIMAVINIDVPGIGIVSVEGAASEDTLLKILEATKKSEAAKKKEEKEDIQAAKKAAKALGNAADSAEDLGDALDNSAKQQKKNDVGWSAASKNFQQSLKNLGVTAVAVSAKLLTSADQMADNPIAATRDIVNTGIDVIANFAGGLAGAIPVVGGFIKGMSEATAELAKMANNMFADQLQKSVNALQTFNKSGVSFAGGMTEMANVAHSAGLGIKDFSAVVSKSKDQLNLLGLSGGEASMRLASSMGEAAKLTGKSGQSLRSEMFKMGYTYEEQGELLTNFMANQQASGKLRSMTDREVAAGAREYATNLKVISDLTGKDAKELMNRARAESMRGALMTKLDADQRQAYMEATSMLSKAGPEVQAALTQFLTFDGAILDPAIAVNPVLRTMVERVGRAIQAANTNMTDVAQQAMADAHRELSTSGATFAEVTDKVLLAGLGGPAADTAKAINQLMAAMGGFADPDAAKRSKDTTEAQATAMDELSTETSKLYDTTKQFQVLLEQTINKELGTYAGLLKQVNEGTIGLITTLKNKLLGEETGVNRYQKAIGQTSVSRGPNRYQQAIGQKETEIMLPKPGDPNYKQQSTTAVPKLADDKKQSTTAVPKLADDKKQSTTAVPKLADGGVVTGPASGYRAVLHGNEAVVPLPDGKTIPVKMQEQQLSKTADSRSTDEMREMLAEIKNGYSMTYGAMQQMIAALNRNNQLTSGILQTSY
jgi:hypothetical protein